PRPVADRLAAWAELVELRRLLAGHAPRQHLGLPERDRQRERLQRDERLAQRRSAVDSVPTRQETPERRLLRRLALFARRRERGPPEPPQDVGVAPFPFGSARAQLAADEHLLALELVQHGLHVGPEALVRVGGGERAASLRVPENERSQRLLPALEVDVRQAGRRHHAEGVAIAPRVLGRDQALLTANANLKCPALRDLDRGECLVVFTRFQVAAQPQEIVELVRVPRGPAELSLDLLDRVPVEQVPELFLAEQLTQQFAVE